MCVCVCKHKIGIISDNLYHFITLASKLFVYLFSFTRSIYNSIILYFKGVKKKPYKVTMIDRFIIMIKRKVKKITTEYREIKHENKNLF